MSSRGRSFDVSPGIADAAPYCEKMAAVPPVERRDVERPASHISAPRMFPQARSAHADAAGACGHPYGGHLGEGAVAADLVNDDLRHAVGQDVQVMLADADALVERVRCGVVLDQGAAE